MTQSTQEIFSVHLIKLPFNDILHDLTNPWFKRNIPGLLHSESLLPMHLGQAILSPSRYQISTLAVFAWWKDEKSLDEFLNLDHNRKYVDLNLSWHIRMTLYRRWGHVSEIGHASIHSVETSDDEAVVAVTLARLKVSQTLRFIQWGLPVEKQVRDHPGQTLALVAMRPPNHFSTITIWKNEAEMKNMVHGKNPIRDGKSHRLAMKERERSPFHHEFTTMRFKLLGEYGSWQGKSDFLKNPHVEPNGFPSPKHKP